jgi:hypothetical protein
MQPRRTGSGCIDSRFLEHGTSWRFHAPAALTPGKEPPVPIGQEVEWAPVPVWTPWRDFFILPGLELQPLGRPARSQSLYRLSYSGSYIYIVTDLINALPGNSSVNTVQHATIQVAVSSVSAVTSRSGGWGSRDMCFLWCVSVPRLCKWQN